MKNVILYIIFIATLFTACRQTSLNSEKEYFRWISENLQVSKSVNDLELSARFLPPEYLAYKDLKGTSYTASQKDSLIRLYSNGVSILLSINPIVSDGAEAPDLMYYGINSKEEYDQRLNDLNFNLSSYIQLKTEKNTYSPVLHVFENTYGISSGRSIYLVFSPKVTNDDLTTSPTVELVFNDLIFTTGVTYFSFKREVINRIPSIGFW